MNGLLLDDNFDEISPLVMGHINLLSILAYDVQNDGRSVWPEIEVVDCYMTKPQM